MPQVLKTFRIAIIGVLLATAWPAGQAILRPGASPTDSDLFDARLLQRIELQVGERDWNILRVNFLQNTYYPATLVWQGQTVRNVEEFEAAVTFNVDFARRRAAIVRGQAAGLRSARR